MDPHDLAGWLQQEQDRVSELIHLVRRQLAVPPPPGRARWIPEARECFRHLTDHMKRHMALEEQDEYLGEVRARRPTLSHEVDQLQHEHGELERLMEQIQSALEELQPPDTLLIRNCCVRIATLLSYIEQHEEQERRLVLHVFCDELGRPG
jgi:iron-sulfur cluster repair protein YtfE (RIC family)